MEIWNGKKKIKWINKKKKIKEVGSFYEKK